MGLFKRKIWKRFKKRGPTVNKLTYNADADQTLIHGWYSLWTQSYDDVEGLLVNLFILASLMISFNVAVMFIMEPAQVEFVQTASSIRWNPEFCNFAKNYLKRMKDDVADFDDNIIVDADLPAIAVHRELMCDIDRGGLTAEIDEKHKLHFAVVNAAARLIPTEVMNAWYIYNSKNFQGYYDATGPFQSQLNRTFLFGTISFCLLMTALICSLCLYLVLVLTPAREYETNEVTRKRCDDIGFDPINDFMMFFKNLILFGYACAITGVITFAIQVDAMFYSVVVVSDAGEQSTIYGMFTAYEACLFFFPFVISVVMSFYYVLTLERRFGDRDNNKWLHWSLMNYIFGVEPNSVTDLKKEYNIEKEEEEEDEREDEKSNNMFKRIFGAPKAPIVPTANEVDEVDI